MPSYENSWKYHTIQHGWKQINCLTQQPTQHLQTKKKKKTTQKVGNGGGSQKHIRE